MFMGTVIDGHLAANQKQVFSEDMGKNVGARIIITELK